MRDESGEKASGLLSAIFSLELHFKESVKEIGPEADVFPKNGACEGNIKEPWLSLGNCVNSVNDFQYLFKLLFSERRLADAVLLQNLLSLFTSAFPSSRISLGPSNMKIAVLTFASVTEAAARFGNNPIQ